jgi:hypothetical protein
MKTLIKMKNLELKQIIFQSYSTKIFNKYLKNKEKRIENKLTYDAFPLHFTSYRRRPLTSRIPVSPSTNLTLGALRERGMIFFQTCETNENEATQKRKSFGQKRPGKQRRETMKCIIKTMKKNNSTSRFKNDIF